uniref:NADH-ubiquinone oxidoreductase chain 6 n=1 Tax=Scolytus seulensis TaxID=1230772 RepID=A0A6G6C8S9_9CUCU|nr:NADH dehydrogenase subunit 6 [Scolytus seulensis]QID77575.1 NADH dehydrogenase subunit 6 [Scolytus seulensis]
MTELLLPLSWSLSVAFLMITHPLALGAVLMSQAIMIALICSLFNTTAWFSYILFLVMVGGMLVMFIYMTSVASNEKFNLPKNKMLPLILMMAMIMNYQEDFIKNMDIHDTFTNTFHLINLIKYYAFPMNQMLMFLMIYLLFVLIASVKIAKIKNSTYRKK